MTNWPKYGQQQLVHRCHRPLMIAIGFKSLVRRVYGSVVIVKLSARILLIQSIYLIYLKGDKKSSKLVGSGRAYLKQQ